MSELRIYEENARPVASYHKFEDIRDQLERIGVQFERWEATKPLDSQATQDEIIEAYRGSVNRLMNQYGFKSVDIISTATTNSKCVSSSTAKLCSTSAMPAACTACCARRAT